MKRASRKVMTRRLFGLLVAATTCLSLLAQNKVKTDWERDGLKGMVWKIYQKDISNDGTVLPTTFEYTKDGFLKKKVIENDYRGGITWIPIDDDFATTCSLWYGYERNVLTTIMLNSYNSKGLLAEQKMYDVKEMEMSIHSLYEYDSTGLTQEIKSLNQKNNEYIDNDYSIWTKSFVNDVQGNPIKAITNGDIEIYKYRYDDKGNWIRKDVIKGNVRVGYFEREIEYYK